MTETNLRKEINGVFDRNKDNPYFVLFNGLHRPPDTPGNVSCNTPMRAIVTGSLVGLILEGKKQWLSIKGRPAAGKTSTAGAVMEAVNLICEYFDLTPPVYHPHEDSQERAKQLKLVSSDLTSGPRNGEGHYTDLDYYAFEIHTAYLGVLGLSHWDYLITDGTQTDDRMELLHDWLTNRRGILRDVNYDRNELYITAQPGTIVSQAIDFREKAQQDPELVREIMRKLGFENLYGALKVRGGGLNPTIEVILNECSRLYRGVRSGAFDLSPLSFQIKTAIDFMFPDKYLEFIERVFTPKLYSKNPPERYSIVRNRSIRGKNIPPVSPALEDRNLTRQLKLKWDGSL